MLDGAEGRLLLAVIAVRGEAMALFFHSQLGVGGSGVVSLATAAAFA
jgi:hypothetical protein